MWQAILDVEIVKPTMYRIFNYEIFNLYKN